MPHIDDGTLHALLDGALRAEAPERADAVEAHLDACVDCRARLEHAAALRDEASDVLANLDAGLEGDRASAPVPDFGEVLARAKASDASGAGAGTSPADADAATNDDDAHLGSDPARLRRQLGWTRGLAWAATIVVALGAGYMVRDLAGPTGEVPRAVQPAETDASEREPMAEPLPADGERAPAARSGTGSGPDANVAPGRGDVELEVAAPSIEVNANEAPAEAGSPETAPRPDAAAVEDLGGISNLSGAPTDPDLAKTTAEGPAVLAQRAREGVEGAAAEAEEPAADAQPRFTPMQVRPSETADLEASRSLQMAAPVPAVAPGGEGAALLDEVRQQPGATLAEATVTGCYALQLGEWSPERSEAEAPYQTPAAVFELTDSLGPPATTVEGRGTAPEFEEGRLLLRPLLEPRDNWMGGNALAYWVPIPPDSVRLVWSNGYVAVRLELGVRGDTLLGRAIGGSHVRAPVYVAPTAPARAVRISCEELGG